MRASRRLAAAVLCAALSGLLAAGPAGADTTATPSPTSTPTALPPAAPAPTPAAPVPAPAPAVPRPAAKPAPVKPAPVPAAPRAPTATATVTPSTTPTPTPTPTPTIDLARLERERRAQRAQAELLAVATAYQHARTTVTQAKVAAAQADVDAEVAGRDAVDARQVLAAYAAHIYRQGYPDSLAVLLSTDPADVTEVSRSAFYNERIGAANSRRLHTARAAVTKAKDARRRATDAHARATAAERAAARALDEMQERADAITAAFNRELLVVARQREEQAAAAGRANDEAARRWQAYLAALAAARVVPPPAATLADPARLPAGLTPVRDRTNQPVPGVAVATTPRGPLTVLPAETVKAVSAAIGALGTPYLPDAAGPEFYDCGRLTAHVWRDVDSALPAEPARQQAVLRAVPAETAQIGDLVFVGTDTGTDDVAIYLGGGQVLGASAAAGQVQVSALADSARISYARATLPRPDRPAKVRTATGLRCGAPDLSDRGGTAWGGYPNGMIPAAAMCPLPGQVGHLLRCDAARAIQALSAAYLARWHTPLCLTDSYRSIAGQIAVFATKPDLAAFPGTSEHGWGVAVDLCGGIQQFGTPQHTWMLANAPRFGWVLPTWARPAGSKPEPWHWEFAGRALTR